MEKEPSRLIFYVETVRSWHPAAATQDHEECSKPARLCPSLTLDTRDEVKTNATP
jgi:hypothetical protein